MMKYKPKNRFINDLHDVLEPVLTGQTHFDKLSAGNKNKPRPNQAAHLNKPGTAGQQNFKWQEHNQQRFHSAQPPAQNKTGRNVKPAKNINHRADDWSSFADEPAPTNGGPARNATPAGNAAGRHSDAGGLTPYQAKQKMRQQQTAYQQQQVQANLAKQNFTPTANAALPVGVTQNIRHKLHYQPINQGERFNPSKNSGFDASGRKDNPVTEQTKPLMPRLFNKNKHQPAGKQNAEAKSASLTSAEPLAKHTSAGKLKIIPLGGNEEVGRNMTIFEYGEDIVILDMGLQFPEEDMLGIDFIIPNVSYLKGKERNIKAVLFSHGHLDHIGAAPMLLEKLNYPTIVGRPLTLAMIRHRQEDYKPNTGKLLSAITIKTLNDVLVFGNFRIKFFQIDHSIMDAVGLIIETPVATVIHPGDWTLEKDEQGKPRLDYSHLADLKRPTVLMLESLGATDIRPSASTQDMQDNLTKLLTDAPGRVIIGTFASQIERVGWIIGLAESLNKKIILDGFSMKNNIEIAQELGYVKPAKGTLIKMEEIAKYPDNRIVVLATGAQGETNASLSRIISGNHRLIKIQKSDTVIFSSSVIPGNERSIQTLKDKLYRQCDNVIHGEIMDIHVSGHANRTDIAYLLRTIRPNYFLPVYAYHYMLHEAANLAKSIGFPGQNIFILDNGQVTEFDHAGGRATKTKVPAELVMIDGLGEGGGADIVVKDRQALSEAGMIVIISQLNVKTGELVGSPDIISRGFIYMKENQELLQKIRQRIRKIVKDAPEIKNDNDLENIKSKIRVDIGGFLFQQTHRKPVVLPVLLKIGGTK